MKTTLLLAAQYDGMPIVPVKTICEDFFAPMNLTTFLRRVSEGQIAIPIVSLTESAKSPKGIHIDDLASYLDKRRAVAIREFKQLHG